MKTTASLLSVAFATLASPAFAADGSAAQYFQANSAISVAALVFATSVMVAVRAGQRHEPRRAPATAEIRGGKAWREEVLARLDADLQDYSRQLRKAA